MTLTFSIGSDVYETSHWETGEAGEGIHWYVVGTYADGSRAVHTWVFDTEDEAAGLMRRIEAHLKAGGDLNPDHWREGYPAYGSEAYIRFEANEIAPAAMMMASGNMREEDLPDHVRSYF